MKFCSSRSPPRGPHGRQFNTRLTLSCGQVAHPSDVGLKCSHSSNVSCPFSRLPLTYYNQKQASHYKSTMTAAAQGNVTNDGNTLTCFRGYFMFRLLALRGSMEIDRNAPLSSTKRRKAENAKNVLPTKQVEMQPSQQPKVRFS